MRLRVLLSDYPKLVIDALDGCGIKTDEDLLCSASVLAELWQRLPPDSITYSQLEEIRGIAIKSLSATGMTGTNLLRNSVAGDDSGEWLGWTGNTCPWLTELLNSTHVGIVEVSGDKGSAKTALILNMVIACLENSRGNVVHWIDTTGDFSAERASRILIPGPWTPNTKNSSESISSICRAGQSSHPNHPKQAAALSSLNRLDASLAFTPEEALAVLDSIRVQATTATNKSSRERKRGHVRLIVIDPITPLFAPHISATSSEGQAMMTEFMRSLQDLTQELGAIALVANNASAAASGNPASCFEATKLKPALGSTMTFLTDTTLWLAPARSLFESVSKAGAGGAADDPEVENLDSVYIAEVLRSRSYVGPKWWSFKVDENGVLHDYPPPRRAAPASHSVLQP